MSPRVTSRAAELLSLAPLYEYSEQHRTVYVGKMIQ